MGFSPNLQQRLICPKCKSPLTTDWIESKILCLNGCGARFPIVAGIPILIDESTSIFRFSDYLAPSPRRRLEIAKRKARRLPPRVSLNLAARRNFQHLRELLYLQTRRPAILIIGGATAGEGSHELLADGGIDFMECDVSIDDRTAMVCDAHNLPFADSTFDAIIIQAVLLYLPNLDTCIREMCRVLNPGGLVYSEAPFMEQVAGGAYDHYRFTLVGHEYLFRDFVKVNSGITGGPGMAMAWSIQYFLMSFTENEWLRRAIRVACKCTLFWLKYFDLLLVSKRGAVDAAAGTYFLGRLGGKADNKVPAYQGLIRTDVRAWRS